MPAGRSDIFKLSVWRYARFRYLRLLGAYALLAAAGIALRGLGGVDGTVLALLIAVFVAGALIGELLRAQAKAPGLYIAFAGDRIEGPAGAVGRRTGFPLARVDTRRTEQPGAWDWLTGRRTIWSLDGERIQLEVSGFTAEQVDAILARAGCAAHT